MVFRAWQHGVYMCGLGRQTEYALFSQTQQNEALLFFSKSCWNLCLTKSPLNPHRSLKGALEREEIWEARHRVLSSWWLLPMGKSHGRGWGSGFVCDLEGGRGERRKPGG